MSDEHEGRYILVVSLWLRDHDVAAFESFEKRASKLLARHGGTIDLAIRPLKADSNPDTPFEIHIVSFADQQGYTEYRSDPTMQELAAEREKIISRTSVLEGHDASQYLRFRLFPEANELNMTKDQPGISSGTSYKSPRKL